MQNQEEKYQKQCQFHHQPHKYYCIEPNCSCKHRELCQDCVLKGIHQDHKRECLPTFFKFLSNNSSQLMKEIKMIKVATDNFQKYFKDFKRKICESLEACEDYFLNEIEQNRIFKTEEEIVQFNNMVNQLNSGIQFDKDTLNVSLKVTKSQQILKYLNEDNRKKRDKQLKKHFKQIQELEKKMSDFIKLQIESLLPKPHVYEFFILDKFKGFTKQFSGHQDQIFSIARLTSNKLVTGSYDKKIILWDLNNKQFKQNLIGHTGYVSALCKFSQNEFLSGSGGSDNSLRLWDWKKGKLLKIFQGHTRSISSIVKLSQFQFATGSYDKTLRVWNIITGSCLRKLQGHQDWITSLIKVSPDKLASGSHDKTIKIWSWRDGQCEKTLTDNKSTIHSLVSLSRHVIAAGSNSTIQIWNWAQGQCIKTLSDNHSVLSLVKLGKEELACRGSDNSIRIWNWIECSILKVNNQAQSCMTCLIKLNERQLASGTNDNTLIIWS